MTAQPKSNHLQLSVTNFGPIASANIDLRPMTVFVGPSNTGKSYLAILIYALHRFFSSGYRGRFRLGRISSTLTLRRSNLSLQDSLTEEDIARLVEWVDETFPLPKRGSRTPADDRGQLPDFVASRIRPFLQDLGDSGDEITNEVRRSFGVADTRRLVRHRSRGGIRVEFKYPSSRESRLSEPFEYNLAIRSGRPKLTSIIPDEAPLSVEIPASRSLIPFHLLSPMVQRNLESPDETVRKRGAAVLIGRIIDSVFPNTVGPLSCVAHYLPADRTGIMHAHLVAVASVIERAPLTALGPSTQMPELSGVLADFLTRLVRLGNVADEHSGVEELAERLEGKMLGGGIQIVDSIAGYPEFYYQPEGWKSNLPLMHTSSMVSELAPVVLYLRHIVQPGEVLIIEEPESHLHPKMQVEFIRQLAGVVKSGVRVMLTTHSEWVLDELTNLVRLSGLAESDRMAITGSDLALSPDDLGVWLFDPKHRPKGSIVTEIKFDEDFGGFRTGFDEVAIGTYNDYAAISNRISEARSEHSAD